MNGVDLNGMFGGLAAGIVNNCDSVVMSEPISVGNRFNFTHIVPTKSDQPFPRGAFFEPPEKWHDEPTLHLGDGYIDEGKTLYL